MSSEKLSGTAKFGRRKAGGGRGKAEGGRREGEG